MIISFPQRETLYPSSSNASVTDTIFSRIAEWFGRLFLKSKIPSAIADCSIKDELTGQWIDIRNGTLSTRISINGRDYYFDRFTGKYTGTGLGCS